MKNIILHQKSKLTISFAWYDLWIGAFIDSDKKRLYICPFPTILFTIQL